MKHGVDGRKFGRNTSHRAAMFKNMANSVIQLEQVVTTVQKAKEVRRVVDRLITLGKKGTPAARRMAFDRTRDNAVVKKLFDELAPRYKGRNGGYTRVLKLSDRRWGDAAEMAVLELVDHAPIDRKKKPKPVNAEGEVKTAAPAMDPFSRFRKMLGKASNEKLGTETKKTKTVKAKAEKATKTEKAPKKAASKKKDT